jgi:hypothetical protein
MDLHVRHGGIGPGVEGIYLGRVGPGHLGVVRIKQGCRGFDRGKTRAQIGQEIFIHGLCHHVAIGGEGRRGDQALGRRRERKVCAGLRCLRLVGCRRCSENPVAHRLRLGTNLVDRRIGLEDERVKGKGIDDKQLLDIFRVGVGQHQSKQTAQRVADDGGMNLLRGDVLVQLGDERGEHGVGVACVCVAASGRSGKARDLDAIEPVGGREQFCLGIEDGL